ncbi:MAG: hypothetical protein ACXWN0_17980, partial [Isosphaeraceae bacterium]
KAIHPPPNAVCLRPRRRRGPVPVVIRVGQSNGPWLVITRLPRGTGGPAGQGSRSEGQGP